MGPEAKFYQQIKRNFKEFSLIRLENSSLLGTPDLLVCNTSGHFCTIELKVTKSKKIRFSPHQIAFHKRHPKNTFIMVKALGPLPKKTSPVFLFRGSRITELAACGLTLDPCACGFTACRFRRSFVANDLLRFITCGCAAWTCQVFFDSVALR